MNAQAFLPLLTTMKESLIYSHSDPRGIFQSYSINPPIIELAWFMILKLAS